MQISRTLTPLAGALLFTSLAHAQLPDIQIMDTAVYPENLTSTSSGEIFVGSTKGIVYKADPGADAAYPWLHHSEANGILAILGVLADEARNLLWLCSAPNFFGPERSQGVTSVMAFDLDSREQLGNWPFPDGGTCNDITLMQDGTVLATDTPNGRIFALQPGMDAVRLFGQSDRLRGIDGIAFSEDGTLYANNVQTNEIFRIGLDAGLKMGELTSLNLSHELGGPDGMRLIDGNRFIQAEGTIGRLSIVTIDGDDATLTVIDDSLLSTPGATVVGNTAYVIESNIGYLLNPELRGEEPPPFMIYARELP